MNEYETVYILDPNGTEADVDNSIKKISELISRHGGYIFRTMNLGKKTLAYRIKKQSKGYYVSIDYCGDNTTVNEIERGFRLDEHLLRYLTIRLDESVDIETRKKELVEEAERIEKALAEKNSAEQNNAGKEVKEEVRYA